MHAKSIQKLVDNFWYVPGDVFLRSVEAFIWEKYEFKRPILDIGIGEGKIDEILFKKLKNVNYGIDINPKSIKTACKNTFYRKTLVASASKLPFKNGFFNSVIANSTFEHIKHDFIAITEVSRVLKKGGVFAFTVPTPRLRLSKKIDKRVNHYHYRDFDEWKYILQDNGLRVIDYKYYLSPKLVRIWKFLFFVSTFKPYKRELWSYLSDSRFAKYLPQKLIKLVLNIYLSYLLKSDVSKDGTWVFILAEKI